MWNPILSNRLLALADDELIIGHRNSEWSGHAPMLEEDIAFSNIALDEMGHAIIWYSLYSELIGEDPDTYPDKLVYTRSAFSYQSAQFCTLPKGDWAFTIIRQYLFDTLEQVRLEAFLESDYTPLAEAAAKIRPEELYHLRHSLAWLKRLGLGTDESNLRMQKALDALWPYTGQLLDPLPGEDAAGMRGVLPDPGFVREGWLKAVVPTLGEAGLTVPDSPLLTLDRTQQSEHLVQLLGDLQMVTRMDPGARW